MLVIGVTGGVGTGKSTVSRLFGRMGAKVLNADRITHELMRPKKEIWRKVRKRFSPEILTPQGEIDRRALGKIVFADPKALKRLTPLIHPAVRRVIRQRIGAIRRKNPKAVVVLDIPLLIEAGSAYRVDALVVVSAPLGVVNKRLKKRSDWSLGEIRRRQAFQMPLREKEKRAHFVVDNGGTVAATRCQVMKIWNRIKEKN